jgi:hypothetical protein
MVGPTNETQETTTCRERLCLDRRQRQPAVMRSQAYNRLFGPTALRRGCLDGQDDSLMATFDSASFSGGLALADTFPLGLVPVDHRSDTSELFQVRWKVGVEMLIRTGRDGADLVLGRVVVETDEELRLVAVARRGL